MSKSILPLISMLPSCCTQRHLHFQFTISLLLCFNIYPIFILYFSLFPFLLFCLFLSFFFLQDLSTVSGNIKITTRNIDWSVSHNYDMILSPFFFQGRRQRVRAPVRRYVSGPQKGRTGYKSRNMQCFRTLGPFQTAGPR